MSEPLNQPILYVRLLYPEPADAVISDEQSWLLSAISTYALFDVYGFGVPGLKKDKSLGEIFPNISPRDDGTFDLELGLILPDLLPNLDGALEYWIDIPVSDADSRRLAFSNQMSELRFRADDERPYFTLLPRNKVKETLESSENQISNVAVEFPTNTFVTTRFVVSGGNPETAVSENFDRVFEEFVSLLNRILEANLMLQKDTSPTLSPSYDKNTFDNVFVIMRGKEPSIFAHGRFATNFRKTAMMPDNLTDEQVKKLLAYVNGTTPTSDVRKTLRSAKSYIDGGLLRHALLEIAIACEIATQRYIHTALTATGTSKKKLEDVKRDLTFSMMLNVLLFALAPGPYKPSKSLVATINAIRQDRNKLMHEGVMGRGHDKIQEYFNSAQKYVDYLEKIAQTQGFQYVA